MSRKRQLLCGICNSEKRLILLKSGKDKLVCDKCAKERSSIWQKQNKDKTNKKNRKWDIKNLDKKKIVSRISKLKKTYGLSLETYNFMLNEQNHKCKICNKPEIQKSNNGTIWSLSVDHCHNTGEIRGLLCSKCNVGLSKFEENIDFFNNAIKYLQDANQKFN